MANTSEHYGITTIGMALPMLMMSVEDLAQLRNEDPNKYTIGLGCQYISLCEPNCDVVTLAVRAAQRAIQRWQGDPKDIGLIAVGTETAMDMSRPLSAWVAEKLNLSGAVRSFEVKHACYGGTLALRHAYEWKLAQIQPEKVALVIMADVALYAQDDPGEPTQGAGAVAMIIDEPLIAKISPKTYAWSEPAFDFWRPEGRPYPFVDGAYSLDCYKKAAKACFNAMLDGNDPKTFFNQFDAMCFHVPFPKMVKKAFTAVGEFFDLTEQEIQTIYAEKIDPHMAWNRCCGNAYTASLWIAVAKSLGELKNNDLISAFSYGSGFGSELLTLEVGTQAHINGWADDIASDIKNRRQIDTKEYLQLRKIK